jgi:hypothetical protein
MKKVAAATTPSLLTVLSLVFLATVQAAVRTIQVPSHYDPETKAVKMCAVNFGSAKLYPTVFPFFNDLKTHSGCDTLVHGETGKDQLKKRTRETSTKQLLKEVEKKHGKYGAKGSSWLVPAGVTLHMARCGSTVVANMLQSAARTIVVAEPQPMLEALQNDQMSEDDRVKVLRLFAHLYVAGGTKQARIFWLGRGGLNDDSASPACGAANTANTASGGAGGRGGTATELGWKLVFKMQSTAIWNLPLLRRAFPSPATKWYTAAVLCMLPCCMQRTLDMTLPRAHLPSHSSTRTMP